MKKGLVLFIICSTLFLQASCKNKDTLKNYPFHQENHFTVLFSDDQFINEEGNYYDALLEIKKNHPEKIHSFIVINSSNRELTRHYQITKFPTLLVVENESVIIRVEGSLNKAEILYILENVLIE